MAGLKLGSIGLEPKDVAYLRALVRLYAHTEKLSWSFADVAPYDALLAGRSANPRLLAGFKGVVVNLVGAAVAGQAGADTLAYPLHPEQLREWLKLREASLLQAQAPAPMPTPASVAVPVTAASATIAAAPAPAPALPAASARATAAASAVVSSGRLYQLRRWPDVGLLNEHPAALRMATLISRKALSTAQLAALTDQSESACRRFIGTLLRAGLLIEERAPDTHAGTAAASLNVAMATAVAPVRQGLLASLRRHLGL
ncbi:hypothetical protein [Massilia sp. PWRC2]|uniref:hypothetical protein n=1 Tax=Massilia sp. PWRC2 TaxID=2804626 RepID=UPI003CE72C90